MAANGWIKLLYILIKPACANLINIMTMLVGIIICLHCVTYNLFTLRSDYIYILGHINGEERLLSSKKDVFSVFAQTR